MADKFSVVIEQKLAEMNALGVLQGSMADFFQVHGRDLLRRTEPYFNWQNARRQFHCWSYSNTIHGIPSPRIDVTNDAGKNVLGINFASQDYLSLSSHLKVREAAKNALEEYGPHSAGSPCLQGNTTLSMKLEKELSSTLKMSEIVLFPTGWAAGYGVIVGLVRPDDHIIIDKLIHNCLATGANAATKNVHRVSHLKNDAFEKKLKEIREKDSDNAILVLTEGLFSMDADIPDIATLQDICYQYEATLLVDIAHDFGSMGPNGTGTIGFQNMLGKVDLVMGSFSKTFASNGGFVATHSPAVKQYIKFCGFPHVFSNALSPIQCAIVLEALRIVQSGEGEHLRQKMLGISKELRNGLEKEGFEIYGVPSPIVPVLLGSEAVARLTAALCFNRGLFANPVEYPGVSVGKARFRIQVMANHSREDVAKAIDIITSSHAEAKRLVEAYCVH